MLESNPCNPCNLLNFSWKGIQLFFTWKKSGWFSKDNKDNRFIFFIFLKNFSGINRAFKTDKRDCLYLKDVKNIK